MWNDVFTRKAGEALHPERDSVTTYAKRSVKPSASTTFRASTNRTRVSREGGLIKKEWIKFYGPEQLPKQFGLIVQSWILPTIAGELNDFSVCTTWGLYSGHFYLLDVYRKRLTYPALKRAVEELWRKFKPTKLLIEDKSSGTSLIQELKRSGVFRIESYEPAAQERQTLSLRGAFDQIRDRPRSLASSRHMARRVHSRNHWVSRNQIRRSSRFNSPGARVSRQQGSQASSVVSLRRIPARRSMNRHEHSARRSLS